MSKQIIEFRCAKARKSVEHDFYDLPESSQAAIIRYGAMRFINDKLSGLDPQEAGEKFDEIYLQLREGWVGRQGGGGRAAADPVEKEMASLARERIAAALRAKGIKQKDLPKGKMQELIQAMVEKDSDTLRPQAEKIVEMKNQKLDLGGIDLDDLV